MYVEDMVVKDILELRLESDDIPTGSTLSELYQWYEWALKHGIIETLYRHGELQGYFEWVKLDEVPGTVADAIKTVDYEKDGSVIYMASCCVRDDGIRHGTFLRLFYSVCDKNPNAKYFCWHDNGKIKTREFEIKEEVQLWDGIGI